MYPWKRLGWVCALVLAPGVRAHEEEPIRVEYEETVEVEARADSLVGIADSATEGVTGREDLEQRPKLRPGELVETVPGMIATQHSGGGKANQYFLRGFNLDHGTDFRTSVEGMQVNFPTHGHGQGYTDLNFLIPEIVDAARYRKGPYDAESGDFAAAGSVDFELVSTFERPVVEATGGGDGYGRLFAVGSTELGTGTLTGAAEAYHYDGPWDRPDDYRRVNLYGRWARGDAANGATLTLLSHAGRWDATDQIPERAVEQGIIGLYGNLDADLGGETDRNSLSFRHQRSAGSTWTRWTAYAIDYRFRLLSNFTYLLDDPANGDEFLQRDERQVVGGRFDHQRVAHLRGRHVRWHWGADLRADFIDVGLYRTTAGTVRETTRADDVVQLGGGAFGEAQVAWTPWLRTRLGLRADAFRAEVDGDRPENDGTADDTIVSPKLTAVFGPWRSTEIYLNYGNGHHSNDARGTIAGSDPLVRARGADVGVRTTAVEGLQTTASVFVLDLDSELVFVGDAGSTEAGRPSRRTGVEITNFWRVRPWLSLDLDVAFSKGRFTDDDPAGDRIPGSIESAVAAGASVSLPSGWNGALRWRYFGPRPLIEDDSVRSRSTSLVNLRVGRRFGRELSLAVEVFNLLDREDSDIAYFYASRLEGEPPEGIEDVHFHPMEPRSYRLVAGWSF